MTLGAASSVPSDTIWDVIRVLLTQVELARFCQGRIRGRLEYFRQAVGMQHFPVVVNGMKGILGRDLFSTIRDLESIENAVREHDRSELIVQFCMILHFFEILGCHLELFSSPNREHGWLFERYDCLETIAYARSRLHFVRNTSYLREAIDDSIVLAVKKCVLGPRRGPVWQGLLLVFRESRPICVFRLLRMLRRVLRDGTEDIPRDAATLFLSYAADAIRPLTVVRDDSKITFVSKLIERLLKLGASPMISREHHQVLYKRLEDRIQTEGPAWWTEPEEITPESAKPFPTALKRILTYEWGPEFSKTLAQYTCCSLDVEEVSEKNYNLNIVPRLQCLASRGLRESDLRELSSHLKFIVSKHRPS